MTDSWPPDGFEAIGDYAFEKPLVPTWQQVEDAEMLVFSHPAFLEIQEEQRRLNVVRLATAAASASASLREGIKTETSIIPLIGGVAVIATSKIHEGTVVTHYHTHDPSDTVENT
jgi:hypothetical protein